MDNKREEKSESFLTKRILTGLVALFLLLAGITGVTVTCFILEQKVLQYRHHYGVIFDAGSSHTDVTVYRWPSDVKDHGTAHTEQIRFSTCSDTGISSYETNPSQAGTMLQKCIETIVLKSLPHKDVKQTGIYVGATAGMRLLCERNPTACNQIMDSVRLALNLYKFRQTKNRVRILTGDEEATFGWITANLLKNALTNDLAPNNNSRLIGSLDMGGGSVEVAFIPDNPVELPVKDMSQFTLYGQNYTLYTHSYLCYGFRETQRRLMAHLVEASNYTKKVINPCWHKGYNETVAANWVWLSPCVAKVPPMHISNSTIYKFIGNGSVKACENRIRELFNQSGCSAPNCTFDGVFQPSVKGRHFMAHSGFGRIGEFFNISKGDSIRQLIDKGQPFCEKNWQEVSKENAVKFPRKYLRSLCFEALYSYQILTFGFHFEPESNDVQFTQNINGTEVSWSLGFMVNATNAIATESPTYRLTRQEIVIILVIFSVMSIIGLAMLTICIVKRKMERNTKYKYSVINN